MTKANRNSQKANFKKFLKYFKPSKTISNEKTGWYCSELDYRW